MFGMGIAYPYPRPSWHESCICKFCAKSLAVTATRITLIRIRITCKMRASCAVNSAALTVKLTVKAFRRRRPGGTPLWRRANGYGARSSTGEANFGPPSGGRENLGPEEAPCFSVFRASVGDDYGPMAT